MLPDSWTKLGELARAQRPVNVLVHQHNRRPAGSGPKLLFTQSLKALEKLVCRSHSEVCSESISFLDKLTRNQTFEKTEKGKRKDFQKTIKQMNARMRSKKSLQPMSIIKGRSGLESMLPQKPQEVAQSDLFFRIVQMPGIRPSPLAKDKLRYSTELAEKAKKNETRLGPVCIGAILEQRPKQIVRVVARKDRVYGPCECGVTQFRQKDLHFRVANSTGGEVPGLKPVFIDIKPNEEEKMAVAVVFDGVLGDVHKRCLTDTSPREIRFRKSAVTGLQWLQQCFRLVLISLLPLKKTLRILAYFREAQVSFEAAYVSTSGEASLLDYENVAQDLQLSQHRILVVTSIDLSCEDLGTEEDTLYVRAGTKLRLTTTALPAPKTFPPVVLLVPSIRAQSLASVLPFDKVASYIYGLKGRGDWHTSFAVLRAYPSVELTPISSSLPYEAFLDATMPYPKADAMRKCPDKCPKHDSVMWFPSDPPPISQMILLRAKSISGGLDVLNVKALSLASGFLNLLSYTVSESAH